MDVSRPSFDLIIRLGTGTMGLTLTDGAAPVWEGEYAVPAFFRPADIAAAFDQAFADHPALFFADRVEVLVVHGPHSLLPAYLSGDLARETLVRKYIRVRHGDRILQESVRRDYRIGYVLPRGLLRSVKQYFTVARPVHLAAVLWHTILKESSTTGSAPAGRTVWLIPMSGHLAVLSVEFGKLVFSRIYVTPMDSDVAYYAVAIIRLFSPAESYWATLDRQPNIPKPDVLRDMPVDRRYLPSLERLLADYRSCAS